MTFSDIVNQVKIEGNLSGSSEMDSWFLQSIIDLLVQYTAKNKYPQFFVKDDQLLLTEGVGQIELPANLQHFDRDSVRYYESGETEVERGTFLKQFNKRRSIDSGPPKQFIRQGNNLIVTPYVDIANGDYLLIDYWTLPPNYGLEDDFPIESLITTIKQGVLAKSVVFTDIKKFQIFKSQEREAYLASQSVINE